MNPGRIRFQAAVKDFQAARQQAALQEVLARLTGKSNALLSYGQIAEKLKLRTRIDLGLKEIPLDAIVGSVGRYADFTRTFLPRRAEDQERWARVKAAFTNPEGPGLPPIEVYQVGSVYFVLDGNHRVSVARLEGLTHIEAHVIEVRTSIPLAPDLKPDDLIVKAEYAEYLEQTELAERFPEIDLSLTVSGQYEKLKAQIEIYRYSLEQEQECCISFQDAAENWYTEAYLPVALAIRERGLLRWFPGRTEADLYLWVSEHREALEKELGWAIRADAAVTDLAVKESTQAENEESAPGSWRKARLADRYTDRLFMDLLVPLEGTPDCWLAFEQALYIAQREGAHLHGLHIVATEAQKKTGEALAVQDRFYQQCAAAGVPGSLAIETGEVTRKVCERALLSDLIVLDATHPPALGWASLGSGLRRLIWRSARPILAVPGNPCHLERALLLYDGSPKAKEALFVATYLAEIWKSSLTVLTVPDPHRASPSVQDYARAYLEMHELQADFLVEYGQIDLALRVMAERNLDLMILGGYSVPQFEEVMGRSAVNFLLRESHWPLFICR